MSDAFYTRLLQPQNSDIGAVDAALVKAYTGLASRLDVHVPALYSRLGDQPLFSPAVDRELTGGEIHVGIEQLDTLLIDPRLVTEGTTVADLSEQFAHNTRVRTLVTDVNAAVARVDRELRAASPVPSPRTPRHAVR